MFSILIFPAPLTSLLINHLNDSSAYRCISKIKQRLIFFSWVLLAPFSISFAHAGESNSFVQVVGEDFTYTATAPTRWNDADLQKFWLASYTVFGTYLIADTRVRDFMRQQPRGNNFLNTVENFGQTYALGVMGGFYLAGILGDSDQSVRVSQDLVAASLVSATLNQTLKITVNRYRPRDNQGTFNAQGYTGLNNNSSFSSGHTTEAFTLASVIATHYEEDAWVACAAYSMAGLVGVARMYNDAHFASDVVASAFIGTYVGKSIVNHNRTLRTNKLALLPIYSAEITGIQLLSHF